MIEVLDKPSQRVFLSPDFLIKSATQKWELDGAEKLRNDTFCKEQGVFKEHDRDKIDDIAMPLIAISTLASEPDEVVGTVRIHEQAPRIWWGSRLAVAKSHRRVGRLGSELIHLAVRTANAIGCDQFLAHVQPQNEKLFQRLNWRTISKVDLHGSIHIKMEADLSFYPAYATPHIGWTTQMKRGSR